MKKTQAPEVQDGQEIWRTVKPELPEKVTVGKTCLRVDESGNMLRVESGNMLLVGQHSYVHGFGRDWHLDEQVARTCALELCQAKARNLRRALKIIESHIKILGRP